MNPSGRLPVTVPRHVGAQPTTYLGSALARRTKVSSIDPSPLYPFGHGLSYTSVRWERVECQGREWRPPTGPAEPAVMATDGQIDVAVTVTNVGSVSAPRWSSSTCTTRSPRSPGPPSA